MNGCLTGCVVVCVCVCVCVCMGVYACLCVWACGLLSSMDLNFRILLKDSPGSRFIPGFNKITFDIALSNNLPLLNISRVRKDILLPV